MCAMSMSCKCASSNRPILSPSPKWCEGSVSGRQQTPLQNAMSAWPVKNMVQPERGLHKNACFLQWRGIEAFEEEGEELGVVWRRNVHNGTVLPGQGEGRESSAHHCPNWFSVCTNTMKWSSLLHRWHKCHQAETKHHHHCPAHHVPAPSLKCPPVSVCPVFLSVCASMRACTCTHVPSAEENGR